MEATMLPAMRGRSATGQAAKDGILSAQIQIFC